MNAVSQQVFRPSTRIESIWVVVSNIFHFHPYLGKISNLTNIFQMGSNHQLGNHHLQKDCSWLDESLVCLFSRQKTLEFRLVNYFIADGTRWFGKDLLLFQITPGSWGSDPN